MEMELMTGDYYQLDTFPPDKYLLKFQMILKLPRDPNENPVFLVPTLAKDISIIISAENLKGLAENILHVLENKATNVVSLSEYNQDKSPRSPGKGNPS